MARYDRNQMAWMWPMLGIAAGAIFGIEGVLKVASGVFAVTGIVVGTVFAMVAVLHLGGHSSRRADGRER